MIGLKSLIQIRVFDKLVGDVEIRTLRSWVLNVELHLEIRVVHLNLFLFLDLIDRIVFMKFAC